MRCRKILNMFGYDIRYVCDWGSYKYIYIYIYDTCGYWAGRPIHKDMAVAPPWVKLTIVKTNI